MRRAWPPRRKHCKLGPNSILTGKVKNSLAKCKLTGKVQTHWQSANSLAKFGSPAKFKLTGKVHVAQNCMLFPKQTSSISVLENSSLCLSFKASRPPLALGPLARFQSPRPSPCIVYNIVCGSMFKVVLSCANPRRDMCFGIYS